MLPDGCEEAAEADCPICSPVPRGDTALDVMKSKVDTDAADVAEWPETVDCGLCTLELLRVGGGGSCDIKLKSNASAAGFSVACMPG